MFILLIPVNRLSIFYEFLLTVYTCIQCCVPLNRGLALHIVNGPNDANCPNASSRKKHGKPTNANIRIYGIRNAPKRSKRKKNNINMHGNDISSFCDKHLLSRTPFIETRINRGKNWKTYSMMLLVISDESNGYTCMLQPFDYD